jgi:hypothetical protein
VFPGGTITREGRFIALAQPQFKALTGSMKVKRVLPGLLLATALTAMQGSSLSNAQAADCYALGLELAAKYGGQLARAMPFVQDGQQVCRIVILVPGRDGARPRRAEYVVPAE